MFSIVTESPEQTERLGELIGERLEAGDIVCLYGDLGAGKTSLAFGIAMGLDVEEKYVTSPTFIFVNEYSGRLPLYHIDLYRLKDSSELEGIGFEEYTASDGVAVIEWAERAEEMLPDERLNVYLSYVSDHSREIGFLAEGERYEKLLDELRRGVKISSPVKGEELRS